VVWEEGLRSTVEWYKRYSGRYGNIESALVPHPCPAASPAI
jgi:UDP-glucose 4,6-dehydratase